MAVTLEGGCRVSTIREGDPLRNETLSIWHRIGRATGAQSISLRVLEFGPGLSPSIQNSDCDEVLYVLGEGSADAGLVDLSIDGRTYQVGPDSGIYIRPGQTFAIDNAGPASLVIISSQCPDPDRAPE